MKDAVRRWYLEAEKEAERGDVVSTFSRNLTSLIASALSIYHHSAPPLIATVFLFCHHFKCKFFLSFLQKAQALLGQMLTEGYGCEADPVRGRELSEKARRRGYRMQGVYCEI